MGLIQFDHIKIIQHNIGNGITEPKLAMTDDNIQVVLKTFNGPEGPRVLFNEYFCYRLALMLDLPMPKSGIGLVDDATIVYNECITSSQYGYGFFSSYLKATVPQETIIQLLENKNVFSRLLLFDHIIFNTDRNEANLLVQYYKNSISLYVIDHSHVFINQAIWDANCFKLAMKDKDYFSTRVLEENYYLYEMFFRNITIDKDTLEYEASFLKGKISESKLRAFIFEMPEEWLPSKRDVDALIEYLLYRVAHLDDIIITILKYINN